MNAIENFIIKAIVYPLTLLENIEVSSLFAQRSLPERADVQGD